MLWYIVFTNHGVFESSRSGYEEVRHEPVDVTSDAVAGICDAKHAHYRDISPPVVARQVRVVVVWHVVVELKLLKYERVTSCVESRDCRSCDDRAVDSLSIPGYLSGYS